MTQEEHRFGKRSLGFFALICFGRKWEGILITYCGDQK